MSRLISLFRVYVLPVLSQSLYFFTAFYVIFSPILTKTRVVLDSADWIVKKDGWAYK